MFIVLSCDICKSSKKQTLLSVTSDYSLLVPVHSGLSHHWAGVKFFSWEPPYKIKNNAEKHTKYTIQKDKTWALNKVKRSVRSRTEFWAVTRSTSVLICDSELIENYNENGETAA